MTNELLKVLPIIFGSNHPPGDMGIVALAPHHQYTLQRERHTRFYTARGYFVLLCLHTRPCKVTEQSERGVNDSN